MGKHLITYFILEFTLLNLGRRIDNMIILSINLQSNIFLGFNTKPKDLLG